MTDTLVVNALDVDEGDHDRFTHIVVQADPTDVGWRARDVVAESIVEGTPCRALCGKVWVPSRDPHRYPICPGCRDIAESYGWRVPERGLGPQSR
jgi:hypothetical protein